MKRDRVLSILNAHQAELHDLGVKSLEIFGTEYVKACDRLCEVIAQSPIYTT